MKLQFLEKKMKENQVSSLPIRDSETKEWKGLVDLQDFITFFLEGGDPSTKVKQICSEFFSHSFFQLPLKRIVCKDLSKMDVFMPLPDTVSVFHAMEWFTRGVQRVPVVEESSGEVKAVFSQSTLIEFLAKNQFECTDTVESLGIVSKEIVSSSCKSKAIDVFNLLSKEALNAVPIVDEEERLLDSFSISDLLNFGEDFAIEAEKPVLDFLKGSRGHMLPTEVSRTA